MNCVQLIGNLVRDVEIKETASYYMLKGSIAVNNRVKDGDEWRDVPYYFDFTWFGNRAKACAQYLTKGKKIGLVGNLVQDKWECDGKNHSKISITVDSVDFFK